jgi:SEC-C motif domain protein
VEFQARFVTDGRSGKMHDRSRFLKVGGAWRYVDEV